MDLTSSYYALVVLASATLGLSTYIHKHYIDDLTSYQKQCKDGWQNREDRKEGFTFTEDTKKRKDEVQVKRPIVILTPIALLASALPYSALGQAVNLLGKYWGEIYWIKFFFVHALFAMFAIVLFATLFIFYKLNKFRKLVEDVKDEVQSILITADAEYAGYANNQTIPPKATNGRAEPRIRT